MWVFGGVFNDLSFVAIFKFKTRLQWTEND